MQLPINAGMREAWEERWQSVEADGGGAKQVSFMEAAARLGVGVFASGPLLEGALLQDDTLMVSPFHYQLTNLLPSAAAGLPPVVIICSCCPGCWCPVTGKL